MKEPKWKAPPCWKNQRLLRAVFEVAVAVLKDKKFIAVKRLRRCRWQAALGKPMTRRGTSKPKQRRQVTRLLVELTLLKVRAECR